MSIQKVGFIGIGKLGLPCAEVMAQEYDVTGYDIYPKKSDKINAVEKLYIEKFTNIVNEFEL
jgi:UDP-N-acetyl-D-mannosaminuronate dehydrogenase